VSGHQVRHAVQLWWEGLDRGHHKQGVRQATPACSAGGSPRRLHHSGGVGVHSDHQPVRIRGCLGEHVSTVTSAQVDSDPGMPANQIVQLAESDVGDMPTHKDPHGSSSRIPFLNCLLKCTRIGGTSPDARPAPVAPGRCGGFMRQPLGASGEAHRLNCGRHRACSLKLRSISWLCSY
jgi:hypothetical protein